jgi:hypothetical protein
VGACSASLGAGTQVTLSAVPGGGYGFAGWGGACTGTLACDVTMNAAQSVSASFTDPSGNSSHVPVLATGFNLTGNAFNAPLDVAVLFGNQDSLVPGVSEKIDAVWAWNAATHKWKFYSPQLTLAGIAQYSAANGYEVLATVPAGEGYWANAYQAFNLPEQSGAAINFNSTTFAARPLAWNLLAIGSAGMTPPQFNAAVGASPQNFETLWTWDAALSKWYFYSPQLEQPGAPFTNLQYCTANDLLDFGGGTPPAPARTLGLGAGFWVYRP